MSRLSDAVARAAAEEVAAQLIGTCKSPADLGPDVEAMFDDGQFCLHLDDHVFHCETCGWWCAACEESEAQPGSCVDCVNEEEEE